MILFCFLDSKLPRPLARPCFSYPKLCCEAKFVALFSEVTFRYLAITYAPKIHYL